MCVFSLCFVDSSGYSCKASCECPEQQDDTVGPTSACHQLDQETLELLNKLNSSLSHVNTSYIPSSCKDIKQIWPNSLSGYYETANNMGERMTVYCQMGSLCDSDGPWTRIAYLDMSNPAQKCPGSLREYGANGVRVCGRPVTGSGSCSPVYFTAPADPYTKVCGRVTGY